MFQLIQSQQWHLRRPDRSGFIAVAAFSSALVIAIAWPDNVANALRHPEDSDRQLERHEMSKTLLIPPVEINNWQIATTVPPRKHPRKCRCHIDTQAPEGTMIHHSSQFAMCKLITNDDRQWHKGLFAGIGVEIRWHCTEQ